MTAQDNLSRLKHIVDACHEAENFILGQSKENLKNNRMLALALVKELEIIGEAANNISMDCQLRYPHVPWKDMIGMRNRLVHAYFGMNYDIVWQTVTESLPLLLAEIEAIIEEGGF
ncbi:MAG: HepT-like ribonuclease domain-containing protein [Microcoleaceae cyanobacterium]